MTDNMNKLLMEIKALLRKAHGERLIKIILFGSSARGDDTEHSDLDILVLLDQVLDYGKDLRTNIEALYDLSLRIEKEIHAQPVDCRQFAMDDCPLYQSAKSEGIAA